MYFKHKDANCTCIYANHANIHASRTCIDPGTDSRRKAGQDNIG